MHDDRLSPHSEDHLPYRPNRPSEKGRNEMLLRRTPNLALLVALVIATVSFGLTRPAPVAGQDAADAQIASAMAAGPASITEHATIMGSDSMDPNAAPVVLREGDNGWTCFPDAPSTPSADPMCLDKTFMGWLDALVANKEPNTQVVGLAYMLAGGSDASNIDPYATGPEAGNEWITSPAHVMIIMPGAIDQTAYSTDPLSGGPFIMWAGTPYEHLMMPVAHDEMVTMGEMGAMAEATPAS